MLKTLLCCLCLLPGLALADTAPAPAPTASSPAVPLTDVEPLLGKLVDNAIRPLYRELEVTGNTLAQRSQTFCAEPTAEHFQVLRDGWGETLLAWQRTDALLFGPAVEDQIDFHINFNPPKKSVINGLLNGTEELTPATVDKAGVAGMGLSTLEFLLFEHGKSEADMLALFQGETGKRRCAYVQAASELLQTNLHTIAASWLDDGAGGYATAFRTAPKGNTTFASSQQAIDLLIGKLYQAAEKTAKKRIGNALGNGVQLSGEGDQKMLNLSNAYQLESWRSGYSVSVIRANVEGMQRILVDGGLLPWLRDHNRDGAEKFVANTLEQKLDDYLRLPVPKTDPFTLVSSGRGKELDNYYFLGSDLLNGIKLQLAKILGVNLGFNDNDGD